jgi:predicted nucleotidyltransferase
MPRNIRTILRKLKKGLTEIYGEQLKAVILFGSYARGDARPPDSDIDVMIVLKGEFNHREVDRRSSEFIPALCLEYDVLISWRFVSEERYRNSGMPLMMNVRKEGVAV